MRRHVVRWMGLASVVGAALCASAAPARGFDLLSLVAADDASPEDVEVVFRGAHRQTRTSVRMPLPGSVSYAATIPDGAALSFGYTLSANVFMVESPDLAEPARFRVRFRTDGEDHVLHDHSIDPRNRPEDRGWFDQRIDLAPWAGKTGTLTFEVTTDGDLEKARQSTIYWSAPRIVRASGADEPSLLFITIDCLRADHVSGYGYDRPTTPRLDRLAKSGIRFANAFVSAPMTLPSIPQIFTSRVFPTRDDPLFTAPIARAGISNAAIVDNAWIPLWFSQGGHATPPGTFDRLVSGERSATEITDEAIRWLESHPEERFALYLHYLDAHTPYRPPASFLQRFADPSYRGPIGDRYSWAPGDAVPVHDAADRKKIIALYDAAIAYVDAEVGRVLDVLEKSGRLANTIVIVSADHGEELWDHGLFFHGQSLYDELLHVPLVVHLPGDQHAGRVVETPVRSIDIGPSVLDWMGLPGTGDLDGRSLDLAIEGKGSAAPLVATATQAQFPTRYAIRTESRKLIESIDRSSLELFALNEDPKEQTNRAGTAAETPTLHADLRRARRLLRERGYQVQLVAAPDTTAEVELVLQAAPNTGTFLTLDRRTSPSPARVSVQPDGMRLEASATVAEPGTGFRFDRLLDPRNFWGADFVDLEVRVDGKPLPLERITLGARGASPEAARLNLRGPELDADQDPPCAPPSEGIRLFLWELPGEKPSALPEIKDPAMRERLRALGYLQ